MLLPVMDERKRSSVELEVGRWHENAITELAYLRLAATRWRPGTRARSSPLGADFERIRRAKAQLCRCGSTLWCQYRPPMNSRFFVPCALLVFSGFLAFDIWLVFIWPSGSWQDHAGLWFALVGISALATGFLSTTELRKALPGSLIDNITSPVPRQFLSGNFMLLGLSASFGIALLYGRPPWQAVRRATRLDYASSHWLTEVFSFIVSMLGLFASVVIFLSWFGAVVIYTVLVMPVAYPAYAAVGFSLLAIRDGDAEPERVVLYPGFDPRQIVRDHMVLLSAFTVGGLGTISGFLLTVTTLY